MLRGCETHSYIHASDIRHRLLYCHASHVGSLMRHAGDIGEAAATRASASAHSPSTFGSISEAAEHLLPPERRVDHAVGPDLIFSPNSTRLGRELLHHAVLARLVEGLELPHFPLGPFASFGGDKEVAEAHRAAILRDRPFAFAARGIPAALRWGRGAAGHGEYADQKQGESHGKAL